MNLQRLRELAGTTEAMEMDAEMGGNEMEAGADEMGAEEEMGPEDPMEKIKEIAQRGVQSDDPEECKQCCQEILELAGGGEEEGMEGEGEMGAEMGGEEAGAEMSAEKGMM